MASTVRARTAPRPLGQAKPALAGLGLFAAASALACQFDADRLDKRPLAERLADAPLAFIGRVARVMQDGTVEFQIEHLLHGRTQGERFAVQVGKSSCDLRFLPGERWIYGGTTLFHPSVLLLAGPGRRGPALERSDDAKLAFPPAWQACKSDAECRVLPYGCSATAVKTEFLAAATSHAWKVGGDPRALECVAVQTPLQAVLCEQDQCGVWRLQGYP